MKVEKPKDPSGAKLNAYDWNYTIYKHDASGNTMAVYAMEVEDASFGGFDYVSEKYYIRERNIYGSSRIVTHKLKKSQPHVQAHLILLVPHKIKRAFTSLPIPRIIFNIN